MSKKRFLSLWFPLFGAERILRQGFVAPDVPLAIIDQRGPAQVVSSRTAHAGAMGVYLGQSLRDAQAICPALQTKHRNAPAEHQFLMALTRWAGKFSPWITPHAPDGLAMDITGCAHLFHGETGMAQTISDQCHDLGVTCRIGIADTLGAAWALARFAGQTQMRAPSGDAINQEARATRSRAAKRRHWERGGPQPATAAQSITSQNIAPPGQTHNALRPLPLAALRLPEKTCDTLAGLGLKSVGDLYDQPRAGLARRFGQDMVLRLDQALGATPEPISPLKSVPHFGVRISFPDPIGLGDDILAAFDRLLVRLCQTLERQQQGLRKLRIDLFRSDETSQSMTLGMAQATHDPERIRGLFLVRMDDIDPGFGIDVMRLEAVQTEPVHTKHAIGHLEAGARVAQQLANHNAISDLIGRLGARLDPDAITYWHPVDTHIPEKTYHIQTAAWSDPPNEWPPAPPTRPLMIWPPEFIHPADSNRPPQAFRWRGRSLSTRQARGPERIAPEWWQTDPNWRSGVRDYWAITCDSGETLWIYYAHGASISGGWFCQGRFG